MHDLAGFGFLRFDNGRKRDAVLDCLQHGAWLAVPVLGRRLVSFAEWIITRTRSGRLVGLAEWIITGLRR